MNSNKQCNSNNKNVKFYAVIARRQLSKLSCRKRYLVLAKPISQIIAQMEQAKKFVDPIQLELPNLSQNFNNNSSNRKAAKNME
jgi:hypothetical protein